MANRWGSNGNSERLYFLGLQITADSDCSHEIKRCLLLGRKAMVLEKTLESPLDCKEIKQVNPKGNQTWIFIGRTDAEAETPILWPPDVKNWHIGKDSDAGKDWRREEKGMTENEMVGWHHWLNGYEFEQALGVGSLTWCCPQPTPSCEQAWTSSRSCPSSWWCHPTISSSVISFSCLQSFPASRSFPACQFFTSGGQSIVASASVK